MILSMRNNMVGSPTRDGLTRDATCGLDAHPTETYIDPIREASQQAAESLKLLIERVTMPNRNYIRGRAFEYERMKYWRETMGADAVIRASGSHGIFDLIVFRKAHVTGVQCKLTEDIQQAKRLLAAFRTSPPLATSSHYHQCLEVKVKGSKEVLSVTI